MCVGAKMALFNSKSPSPSSSTRCVSEAAQLQRAWRYRSFVCCNYIGIGIGQQQQQQRCCCCVVDNLVMVMVGSTLKCEANGLRRARERVSTLHRFTNSYFPSSRPSTPKAAMEAADAIFLENVCDFERGTSMPHENNSRDDGKARRDKTVSYSTFRRASLRKQSFTRVEKLEDSDGGLGIILQTDTALAAEKESMSRHLQSPLFSSKEPNTESPYKELKTDLKDAYTKLDSSGRLRTPRAARELTLCILYASMASKMPPVRVFENRTRRRKDFSIGCMKHVLEDYTLSPNSGDPVFVQDEASATKLEAEQEQNAINEAAVLTAPLSLVYNRFVLSMARKIIKATSDRWLLQDPVVNQLFPIKWKEEKGRMIERCILHMAIAEIELIGTSPNIVIDEAVELTKIYCDGLAPRVINGCLGSYCRSRQLLKNVSLVARELETNQALSFSEDLSWNEDNL